jgi:N-acetylneuraminate lyase
MNKLTLTGLVAAAHSPFKTDGSLNLAAVERQAEHFNRNQIATTFVCGSTGESHSLTFEERRQLAERWMEVTRGSQLKVIVHVGTNCLSDARALAAHAESLGAVAVAALAPCYFKPRALEDLILWCVEIAAAAPATPFYYYDIPVLTGVSFSMPLFLAQAAERIPTLNGIKFTNTDLMAFQQCLALRNGAFDMLWGVDSALLSTLVAGATGAVGSTYNFAAPVFERVLAAFGRGDLKSAQQEQWRAVQLLEVLSGYGHLAASKAVMQMLGVDVGPTRLPNRFLTAEQVATLRAELETLGFFDWIAPLK